MGIPKIRLHPTDLDREEVAEQAKGWLLFVRLDMDLPNLELLESTRRANKFLYPGYGSRDLWVRIIEQSAPGYLGLEAKGGRWNSSWMIS
ncbi:hypothetical protein F9C07_11533 [Aspergillus flavus]|uniref:Uncharacterized protein n=1 Tax=Aspergillus flavus (strain ATCC 200026 / FGSC A1120 / IAM 13836 / NRRL 3357 / JCM 12722 / SRRC 167) TaxID=332952 RepID=A0A7U2N477_ASPFN|nr:hypothetical protein F9C07_11533 [Aspergillus flavus]